MGPMLDILNNRRYHSAIRGCKREVKLHAAHILIASSVGLYKPYYISKPFNFLFKHKQK